MINFFVSQPKNHLREFLQDSQIKSWAGNVEYTVNSKHLTIIQEEISLHIILSKC